MDASQSISIKSSRSLDQGNTNILALLKRLKVEDSILLKSIDNNLLEVNNGELHPCLSLYSNLPMLKKLFDEVRNLIDEIKINSVSEEYDIEEIKKDVLRFEENVKQLKFSILSELTALRSVEKELNEQIRQNEITQDKTNLRLPIKAYNSVIRSPVKALINTPMKSKEVQQFQEYVSAHGRHGRWNEYNHNIFVKLWSKYLEDKNVQNEESLFISQSFIDFKNTVLETVTGVAEMHVYEHAKWYLEYLLLKAKQQEALEKWKKKRVIKGAKVTNVTRRFQTANHIKPIEKQFLEKQEDHAKFCLSESLTRLTRSTEQWNSRCFDIIISSTESFGTVHDVNSLSKLQTPRWRQQR